MNLDFDNLEVFMVRPGSCFITSDKPLAVIELPSNIFDLKDEVLWIQEKPGETQTNPGFELTRVGNQRNSKTSGFEAKLNNESYVSGLIKKQLLQKLKKGLVKSSNSDGSIPTNSNSAVPQKFEESLPSPQSEFEILPDENEIEDDFQQLETSHDALEKSNNRLDKPDDNDSTVQNKGHESIESLPVCNEQNFVHSKPQDVDEKEDQTQRAIASCAECTEQTLKLPESQDMSTVTILTGTELSKEQTICADASVVKEKSVIQNKTIDTLNDSGDFLDGQLKSLLPMITTPTPSVSLPEDKIIINEIVAIANAKVHTEHFYTFTQVPLLDLYKDSYLGDNKWKCNVCNNICRDKLHLQKCIQSHNICDICGKKFSDRKHLREHALYKHSENKNFQCRICNNGYQEEKGLNYHLVKMHGIKRSHVCEFCGKEFKNPQKLRYHRLVHTGEKPYSCDLCGQRFQVSGQIKPHLRRHTGEKPYKCELCGKLFNTASLLNLHRKAHAAGRSHYCSYCGKRFNTKQSYVEHMKLHSGEGSQDLKTGDASNLTESKDEQVVIFSEESADRESSLILNKTSDVLGDLDALMDYQLKSLLPMIKSETPSLSLHGGKSGNELPAIDLYKDSYLGDNKWKCNVCNNICKDKIFLQKCIQSHNVCDICGKKFAGRRQLRDHAFFKHTENKHFQCQICSRWFQEEKGLHYHLVKMHSVKLSHVCEFCGKEFKTPQKLRNHNLVHTGEKRYSCDLCGKRFQVSSQIRPHLRSHTGEKPCQCDICGKSFPYTAKLNIHKKTHAKERTHICLYCGKGFYTRRSYLAHTRVHSGVRPFECKTCSRSFKRKAHLMSHKKAIHGEVI